MFRFFFSTQSFRQAGRSMAAAALFVGLLLIGLGLLVFILRDVFAFLAAAVFVAAGFSAVGYALRIFWMTRQIDKEQKTYRHNVDIHIPDLWE